MIRTLFLLLLLTPLHGGETSPVFEDIAPASGLNFSHFNGMTGEFLLPEIMGPGCAFLDYDNDGDLDVYMIQGATYPNWSTAPLHKKPAAAGSQDTHFS